MSLNFGPGNRTRSVTRSDDEKLCPIRGCDALIKATDRACAEHRNALTEKEAQRRRDHPRNVIYRDPRWRLARRYVKERDNWTCHDCGLYDPTGRALVADHVNEGGVLACPDPFDPVYLLTRCLHCSGKKDGARGSSMY